MKLVINYLFIPLFFFSLILLCPKLTFAISPNIHIVVKTSTGTPISIYVSDSDNATGTDGKSPNCCEVKGTGNNGVPGEAYFGNNQCWGCSQNPHVFTVDSTTSTNYQEYCGTGDATFSKFYRLINPLKSLAKAFTPPEVDASPPNQPGSWASATYTCNVSNVNDQWCNSNNNDPSTPTFVWQVPNCNDSISCAGGGCTPNTNGSCATNSGTSTGCFYTTYTGGSFTKDSRCVQTSPKSAPDQPNSCTPNPLCPSGQSCVSGTCISTPAKPTNFLVSADPTCINGGVGPQMDLSWQASSGATNYDIYRMPPGGSPTLMTTVDTSVCSGSNCSVKDQGTWGNPANTLATNTRYTYTIDAKNSNGTSAQTGQVFANSSYCDTTPPTANITGFPDPGVTCYTSTTWGASKIINVNATDPTPPPSPSGVSSVSLKLTNTNTGTVITGYPKPMATPSASGQPWTLSVPSGDLTAGYGYKFEAQATDNAGNPSALSAPASFAYETACLNPYLKTTGGDVHSNTNIDIRGGP